jgi:hypothetical protein
MTTSRSAKTSTKFLAKLLGLWIVLAVLAMIFNRQQTLSALSRIFTDPGLAFVTGIFTLAIGIAMVLNHNRWSGGALPIVVTLCGWTALIKGLLFLILPTATQVPLFAALHLDRFYYFYLVFALVVGGYLTYAGFTPSGAVLREPP